MKEELKKVFQEAKEKYPQESLSIFHVPRREDKYLLV